MRAHRWTDLHPDLAISVTIGIAVSDRSHDRRFDCADAALYAAKDAGRHQAVVMTLAADGSEHPAGLGAA